MIFRFVYSAPYIPHIQPWDRYDTIYVVNKQKTQL